MTFHNTEQMLKWYLNHTTPEQSLGIDYSKPMVNNSPKSSDNDRVLEASILWKLIKRLISEALSGIEQEYLAGSSKLAKECTKGRTTKATKRLAMMSLYYPRRARAFKKAEKALNESSEITDYLIV